MERESLDVDVLYVGAGSASLASAIALKRKLKAANKDITILVLEKAEEIGFHQLSGAVMDLRALRELEPEFDRLGFPHDGEVVEDEMRFFTEKSSQSFRGALLPPPLRNHGNRIVSIFKVVRWLKDLAEKEGVDVYPGFPADSVLEENGRVAGVRIRDMGIDKNGGHKSTFAPGMDIRAKITIFAEGTRGSLTKKLVAEKKLDAGRNPMTYGTGFKEIWEIKQDLKGKVIHTLGHPLTEGGQYGGGWVYGLPDHKLSIGFVIGLNYRDPRFDPHAAFNRWKSHPWMKSLLDGGTLVRYGAKTLPYGGYYAMPKMYGDGFLVIGDAAGFLNSARLKGIHLAMKSGMLAADTIYEALEKNDFSEKQLSIFNDAFEKSWAREELYEVRNFHQAFEGSFWWGMFKAGMITLSRGRMFGGRAHSTPDHEFYRKLRAGEDGNAPNNAIAFDDKLTFDKLKGAYYSGTMHDEDQPSHLKILDPNICATKCAEEYGNPCQRFCPAYVYEWDREKKRVNINFSNCVHCKTCDIADPYQIIDWTVPEGGGGPKYLDM
ncbi:MAG: electron transfer flavoprotein-ubiquinone oxidoreductase [Planctomycetes bacterium]|nr:electron transfer flavoprotein-ubiquinone oxidoreductase [Planctomycetota bacterium]